MTTFVALTAGVALFALIESVWRFREGPSRSHFLMDVKFLLGDVLANLLVHAARVGIPMVVAWRVGNAFRGPLAASPSWLQLAVGVISLEFAIWFTHWCWHRFDFLYPFHAVHHASTHVYFLSGLRQHPVQFVGDQLFIALVMAALGLRPAYVGLLVLVQMFLAFFTHANLNLRFGPLKYVFTSPRMHLLHHTVERRMSRKNLGGGLSLFDWIFGTAVDPDVEPVPRQLGSSAHGLPATYWGQFLWAFRKAFGR